MLSIISDLPPDVVGIKASGNVTKEEFQTIVVPAVEAQVKLYDKINYLLVLETSISNFEGGALLKDAAMGLKHFFKWNKVAVVTEQKAVEAFSDIFSIFVPGQFRGYKFSQLDEAKAWLFMPEGETK